MLGTLFRYEAALMNAFNRTLQQLLFLQAGGLADVASQQLSLFLRNRGDILNSHAPLAEARSPQSCLTHRG
jgi:hypothetical protein